MSEKKKEEEKKLREGVGKRKRKRERAVMFVPGGRASGKIRNSSCFISGSFCRTGIDIDKR